MQIKSNGNSSTSLLSSMRITHFFGRACGECDLCFLVMMSASFMTSNGAMKPSRVGLSEYTARRLAELKARRAEADDTGGISIGASSSSSTAAAEATVNDGDSSTTPPPSTPQHSTTPVAYTQSLAASSSSTAAHVLQPNQLPAGDDLSSPSYLPKPVTVSQVISAPTAAVSNGVPQGSSDMANVTARIKQLENDKSESGLAEQRRNDRQDLSNVRPAATEPSKLPVQHREIPQPPMRMGSRFNDATTLSGTAAEVGALSKMVSVPLCLVILILFFS